jgi:hypothetical protein
MTRRWLSPILLLAGVAGTFGCATPTPNDLVLLDFEGGVGRYALSTEDGIVAISSDDLNVTQVPIRYWFRSSPIRDDAKVLQRTNTLTLLAPVTTRLEWTEFSTSGPEPGEELFVGLIDEVDPEHLPYLLEAELLEDGKLGDVIELGGWFSDPDEVAGRFGGAGVYAKRMGRYVLVGILTGTVVSAEKDGFWSWFGADEGLPFIGLDGIAPVLPQTSNFFERRQKAYRPDFEYGLDDQGQEPNRRTE